MKVQVKKLKLLKQLLKLTAPNINGTRLIV